MATRERKKPRKCVRLGCEDCDRDDYDGITDKQLEKLRATWIEIREIQSWEYSVTVWTPEQNREFWKNDKSDFCSNWETHVGVCPECQQSRDEYREEIEREAAERNRMLF